MPTYSYRCEGCGESVDESQSIKHHTNTIVCIGCGSTMHQYHKTPPGIDRWFKGSYRDLNPCSGRFNF